MQAAERRAADAAAQRRHLLELRDEPAVTLDGRRIRLLANAGSLADVTSALDVGAEGVGLFRTEFLFLERDDYPDEETQYRIYRNVVEAMQGRPVTFRLLDVGGDKPLPYHDHPAEANPFLGWRGIRFQLDETATLKAQLAAVIRASEFGTVSILVPMVSQVSEVRAVKALLEKTDRAGTGGYRLGIMVETPAAALTLEKFAGLIDFISIGSNDLAQYVLAAERDNPRVASLYDDLHPAVLAAVALAAKTARENGLGVCVCGELAGRPEAAPILVGAGVEELSMAARSIPEVKGTVRAFGVEEAEALLGEALKADDSVRVRTLCREFLESKDLSVLSKGSSDRE
jgi:phosphoenolpyruvate-protein phosphotransferase